MNCSTRRWIAGLVASAMILLTPGLPAYAQVARVAAGEAGASAVPRVALTGAGISAPIASLTTLSILHAPSAVPAGAPAAVASPAPAPAPAPAAAAAPSATEHLRESASRAAALGSHLDRASAGEAREAADFTQPLRRAYGESADGSAQAWTHPAGSSVRLPQASRSGAAAARAGAPASPAPIDRSRTSARGQLSWAAVSGSISAASGFAGYVLLHGSIFIGIVVPGLAAMPVIVVAALTAAAALGYAGLGLRMAAAMWKNVSPSQSWRERLGLALRAPIATPEANSPAYDALSAPAKALVDGHERTHRNGHGEFVAYLTQGFGHPAYLAREFVGGLRSFSRLARNMAFGDADLKQLVRPHRRIFATTMVLSLFDAVINSSVAFMIAPLLALHGVSALFLTYSGAILGLLLVYVAVELFFNGKSLSMGFLVLRDFRTAYVTNVIRQPLDFLSRQGNDSGALANRAKLDINYLADKNVGMRVTLPHFLLVLIFSVAAGLWVNVYFSAPMLVLIPIISVLSAFYGHQISILGIKQVDLKAGLLRYVQESFAMIPLIRAIGAEKLSAKLYREQAAPIQANERAIVRKQANYAVLLEMLTDLPVQLLYVVGGLVVAAGVGASITLPLIVQLTFIAHFIQYGFRGLTSKYIANREAEGKSATAHEILLREPELKDVPDAAAVAGPVGIRFEHVTYHYPAENGGAEVKVLDDLSFSVAPGETVAFVGETGSGKSTIADVMQRLRDVASGRVLLNGKDVREIASESLHRQFSLVDQDARLFAGTIRDNMKFGSESASDDELDKAIRIAKADFVYDKALFPEGLDTKITDTADERLSGGAEQRVAIVRAVLRRSPVLILDEGTRALDNSTEREVQAALNGLNYKPTRIVIAHRLTTVRNADRINVLARGKIVESGTHDELLARGGVYAGMWRKGQYGDDSAKGPDAASGSSGAAETGSPKSASSAPAAAKTPAAAPPSKGLRAGLLEFGRTLKNFFWGDDVVRPFIPRGAYRLAMLLLLVNSGGGLLLAQLIGSFLNLTAAAAASGFAAHATTLYELGGSVLALSLANPWLTRWESILVGNMGIDITWKFRDFLNARLLKRDMRFYRDNPAADMATRLADDVETLVSKNLGVRLPLLEDLLTLAVAAGLMLYTSASLGAPILIALPVLGWLGGIFAHRTESVSKEIAKARAAMVRNMIGVFSRLRLVKAFGQEKAEAARVGGVLEDFTKIGVRQSWLRAKGWIFSSSVSELFTKYLVYIVGAALGMPIGTIVAMVLFSGILQESFSSLTKNWLAFKEARGGSQQIIQWAEEAPEIADASGARTYEPAPLGLRFEDVGFNYGVGASDALTGLSFEANPGETVAIVGGTSSGKSTVLALAERVREPSSGRILVNGRDLKGLTRQSYADQIAVVGQKAPVFDATVEANLRYGAPADLTDEELMTAVRAAAPFLLDETKFPGGLKSQLGEGGQKVSGGQRQRIAIVRAMLRRPRLLILDEATAALDKATEVEVQDALKSLSAGRGGKGKPTILVVAHNLTTIKNADRILVLERGRVVESGTHRELLERGGVYKRLWDVSLQEKSRE